MNILFIGKYPPIAGGESAKLYWLAKGLSEHGHNVTVISNSHEVESNYQIRLTPNDLDMLKGGKLTFYSSNPFDNPNFIPQYKAFSEKLTTLALDVCKHREFDIVFGWYMLPYWITAYNISKILNKKLILQHAGSDLSRIFYNQEFNSFLTHILSEADCVFSYGKSEEIFEKIGCKYIYNHRPNFPSIFNNKTTTFSLSEFGIKQNKNNTFLFLGKITKSKGIDYLIDAFKGISSQANLLIIGSGSYEIELKNQITSKKIENVYFSNHLANWKIPSIIKSTRALIIPEYNFGVSQHRSKLPIESLLCGKRPIVSEQITNRYEKAISELMISVNPVETDNFSKVLKNLISDSSNNLISDSDYKKVHNIYGNYEGYIKDIIQTFKTTLQG